jgi:apolipoprotein N-acyltransferase
MAPRFSPFRSLPFKLGLVMAALSAVLLSLSFPHARQNWLAWVALVPLLVACRGQGFWRGSLLGLVLGVGFQAALLSWAGLFGPVALVGLVLLKSLAPALLGGVLGLGIAGPAWQRSLFVAAAWVAGLSW